MICDIMIRKTSQYRECQDCKKQFKVPSIIITMESLYPNYKIYCQNINCNSANIAQISKEQYDKK